MAGDLDQELLQPRNLANRAAWQRELAKDSNNSPSKIAAGRIAFDDDAATHAKSRVPWVEAQPKMREAARGRTLGGEKDDGEVLPQWSPEHQARLNDLDERARYSSLLDRFEEFARARSTASRTGLETSADEPTRTTTTPRRVTASALVTSRQGLG